MPTPGDGEGRRRALVVATGTYADTTLAGLRAPGRDAAELAAILQDAAVGGFDVETVLDVPADGLRRRVARFCAQGGPGDLALVYISCHGVLDDRGRLYYATTDTDHELLAATAIPAAWLNEQLDDCRCRRQVVILDCCHSGAFAKGAKGEGALALRERFEGRGRVVLTASRATEYSFEGDRVLGDGVSSVFTDVLVQGLRSGDADRDGDGMVTVTELYDYAYEAVRSRDARQTPMLWTYGAEGGLLVAHSARGAVIEPVPLSDEVMALLESARPRVRESAVAELAELLTGPDPGRALTARAHLERVAAEDIPRVAASARAALEGGEVAPPSGAALPAVPATPPPSVPPGARPAEPSAPSPPPRRSPSRRTLTAAGALLAALAGVGLVALLSGDSDSGGDRPSVPRSGPISMKGSPRGIAAGGKRMWIALHDDGAVKWIGADSSLVEVDVDPDPETIVADDEGTAWVTTGGETALARIDAEEGSPTPIRNVITQQAACTCPSADMAIAFGALWVAEPRDKAIVKRDLLTGDHEGAWPMSDGFEGRFAAADLKDQVLWAVGTTDGENGPAWLTRVDAQKVGSVKPYELKDITHPGGVAVGTDAVWITDDQSNTMVRFDPRTHRASRPIGIDDGVTSDDIVALHDAVLLWNPNSGNLTRVDPITGRQVGRIRVPGYEPGDQRDKPEKQRNLISSELAVANGVAWVTDPAANRVLRVEYDAVTRG
jgi:streptogramin lyase